MCGIREFDDTIEQNLSVVIQDLEILKERNKDEDSTQRLNNSIRILQKWI